MFLAKVRKAFSKTGSSLWVPLRQLFGPTQRLDAQTLKQFEELLLKADIGPAMAHSIVEQSQKVVGAQAPLDMQAMVRVIQTCLRKGMLDGDRSLRWDSPGPSVFVVLGVNGSGKTTTCAKLAYRFLQEGKKVLLAACDTFRAGATDQLEVWAQRLGVPCIQGDRGADPASVAFHALSKGISTQADAILLDTAGRLHTKAPLMEEAKKILRVLRKIKPTAPAETLLVLDATNGQNALAQMREFHSALSISGLVLAKMDAGAKAGVVVALESQYRVPVKMVALGEDVQDLEGFDPDSFVACLTQGPNESIAAKETP